jgi:hypothetical protein
VRAYAFLAQGAVAPLTGFAWPTPTDPKPGAWVDADTAPREALRGCIADHHPYWLDDELWNIESIHVPSAAGVTHGLLIGLNSPTQNAAPQSTEVPHEQ